MLKVKHLKSYGNHTGRRFAAFGVVDSETGEVTFRYDVIIRKDRNDFEMSLKDARQEYLRRMGSTADGIGAEMRA